MNYISILCLNKENRIFDISHLQIRFLIAK